MYRNQRGITLIGWLVLLIPVAIIGYAGIRVTPIYLNYMKVARSMEEVATEVRGAEASNVTYIRTALEKHLDIESVTFPTIKDFVIRRDGTTWVIQSTYEDTTPLLGNISLVLAFDKTVQIN